MLEKYRQSAQHRCGLFVESQVDAIKNRLDKKYNTCDGFHVRVKSIDGFQGEEDDILILSPVISNWNGVVGFLADNQRTNITWDKGKALDFLNESLGYTQLKR